MTGLRVNARAFLGTWLLWLFLLSPFAHAARMNIPDAPTNDGNGAALVSALVARPGGGVIAGGSFTQVGARTGTAAWLSPSTGEVDRAFPFFTGNVNAVVADGAGGWYLGGSIALANESLAKVVHVLATGELDASFVPPSVSGTIYAMALSGGSLYLGGNFTAVGGVARKGAAALDATTGSLQSFDPNVTGTVYTLAAGTGVVYLGGSFTALGATARSKLAEVDATTGAPTAWNLSASADVRALAVSSGRLYAAGDFTQVGFNINRARAAAFDISTQTVTSWNPIIGGSSVYALAVDGSTVYLGGSFSLINGGAYSRSNLAAVDATSGTATSWNPGADGTVNALVVSGGLVYVGGSFTTLAGVSRRRLGAVDAASGSATVLNPWVNDTVNAIAVTAEQVAIAGNFEAVNLQDVPYLAAFDAGGRAVSGWAPQPNGAVTALVHSGNTVYAGGSFTQLGGIAQNALGAVDVLTGNRLPWDPQVGSGATVKGLAMSASTLYAVGNFSSAAGSTRNHAAAFNLADASLVAAWNPNLDKEARAVTLVGTDVYIGGVFTAATGGVARAYVAGFDPAGNLLPLNVAADNVVTSLASSGTQLYLGGTFISVLGTTRNRAAAVDTATGGLLPFDPNPNFTVSAFAVKGSHVYLGGSFNTVGSGGSIVTRNGLAAVQADTGAPVTAWSAKLGGGTGAALAVVGDRIYAGGSFTYQTLSSSTATPVFRGGAAVSPWFLADSTATEGLTLSHNVAQSSYLYGAPVTDIATVTALRGSGNPGGAVQFYDCHSPTTPVTSCDAGSGTPIGAAVALAAGVADDGIATATLSAWQPALGYHRVHATYAGSAPFEQADGGDTDRSFEVTGVSADLSVSVSNAANSVAAGQPISYTIVVTNAGSGAVTGATVSVSLPAALSGATWTCAASSGAACAASGTGNVADTVNLPGGGVVTYTLTAAVSALATGTVAVTAQVVAPLGVFDADSANNSGTDTDPVMLPQTVIFAPASPVNVGVSPITLTASASSGLTSFTFSTSSANTICTVSGNTLTIVGAGTCALTATQAGNATYASASANANVVINAVPAVNSVTPNPGATTGGYSLVISGTNLSGATGVTIGGAACTSLSANTATSVTCLSPAGTGLNKAVVVTTASGPSTDSVSFSYSAPSVSGITPNTGSTAGGTSVTISGSNLRSATGITIGGNACTSPSANSDTAVTCTTPAGSAGTASVIVSTASGSSSANTLFTYTVPAPSLSAITPSTGSTAGGTSVTISGSNLSGATGVTIGGVACTPLSANTATSVTCLSPAGTGLNKAVVVTTASGPSTDSVIFSYNGPSVSGITPNTGSTAGGTSVTISGSNLRSATAITIGGNACTSPSANSDTAVTCTTPAGSAGTASVVVTTASGSNSANTLFTYTGQTQTITFAPASPVNVGVSPITLTASASSGLTSFTFSTSSANTICTVSGNTLTIVGAGTCALTATQAGNATYASASANANVVINAVPAVSAITPSTGSTAGGTSVTISGTNLSGATGVTIGGAACTSLSANTATSVTCLSPAGTGLNKAVVVTTASGPSTDSVSFSYNGPSVSGITPNTGSTAGGTSVTISGSNLRSATGITIGGNACTSPSANSDTAVTCTTPAGSAGTASVIVSTASGSSSANTLFTYTVPAPSVSGIAPSTGSTAGGTSVTISGTNLSGATGVTIGGAACTPLSAKTATSVTCLSPAGTGLNKAVVVTTASGPSTDSVSFSYSAPSVSGITPNTGSTAGGTSVTISGTNLRSATGITIGGNACTSPSANSDTAVTCTTPAGSAGTASVIVSTASGSSSANTLFTYTVPAPSVSGITPSTGSTAGGTSVTISGTNLSGATGVTIGGAACTPLSAKTATSVTCLSPAGTGLNKAVVVTTASGPSTDSVIFSYNGPSVSGITPNTGSTAGGTSVTISGSNLRSATGITIGGNACTSPSANSDTAVTCTTPAGSAGTASVIVSTASGSSSANTLFTYTVPAPSVSGITPSTGSTAGGTSVTISGTNLSGATGVTIGGAACTSLSANTATSVTCLTPAGTGLNKAVVVTTASGPSTNVLNFSYAGPSVSGITPNTGSTAGGTSVTISGSNLRSATGITIGGNACTSPSANSDTAVTCTTPAGSAGTASVIVSTASGSSSANTLFTYTGQTQTITFAPASPVNVGVSPITLTASASSGLTSFTFSTSSANTICTVSGNTLTIVGAGTCALTATQAGNATYVSASANANVVINAVPAVSGITPSTGSTAGGTSVTISGTNLSGATGVTIGGAACTSLSANTATSVTCLSPAGTGLNKAVVVTTASGPSTGSVSFSYNGPSVSGISPSTGSTAGGTSVTISGSNLRSATGITIGGNACTSPSANSDTAVTCTTPAGSAGTASVIVSTASGSSSANTLFTYTVPAPSVSGITPSTGSTAGGTSVTISGTNLSGATGVTIGGAACTPLSAKTATSVTCLSPAGTGLNKAVVVTTTSGPSTDSVIFSYNGPSVSGITPNTGSTAGGTSVTISGSNLRSATGITIGGNACTSPSANSDTAVTCTTPAGSAGTASVIVSTASGSSSANTLFTYTVPAPSVSGITPSTGSTAGGTSVTISGTNLSGATGVTIGGAACTSLSANTATSVTCLTPAGTGLNKAVVVTTASGPSTNVLNFSYAGPSVSGITPNTGSTAGGTSVTISGSNLRSATGITIGGNACTSPSANSDTAVTCTTPAGSAGTASVIVSTASGSSSANTLFTYTVPAPSVSGITPSTGSTAGGTSVTISGTNLSGATGVTIGGAACTSLSANTATSVTCLTPAGTGLNKAVVVTTASGPSTNVLNFSYAGPSVSGITPNTGSTAGGTSVTISGSNLRSATGITIGGNACTSPSANSDTAVTCTTPAGSAGTASVIVSTASGSSSANTLFTYTAASYTISTTASPSMGGTVSCTPNPVTHGSNSICTATANTGYTFGGFSGDCTGATCNLSNVTSAKSVTATFTPTLVNAVCGADHNAILTSTPNHLCSAGTAGLLSGSGPWNWTCEGSNGGAPASCSAAIQTWTASVNPSSHGTLSPASATANHAQRLSFTVTPDSGFGIGSVSGCNGGLSGNTYTTGPMTGPCSISATFTAVAVNGSCGADQGQTLIASPTQLCQSGNASLVYGSGPWNWTCAGVNAGTSASCSANAQSYTVSATAGSGGSITPNSRTVVHGGITSVSVSANSGFITSSVSGCNGTLSGNVFTTGAITANCAINASFAATNTTVSISSVTPSPAKAGQAVNVNFSVNASSGIVNGADIVTVSDNNGVICSADVTTGQCTLTFPSAGTRNLVASYAGNGTAQASASTATTLSVVDQPGIVSLGLPSAVVGLPYTTQLVADGGLAPYAFSATGLPDGLGLNASTGLISGTPSSAGNASITVTLTDALAQSTNKVLVLQVVNGLTVATTSLPEGLVNQTYAQQLQALGGRAPYTWRLSSGQLPGGLQLDTTSGRLSGNPTSLGQSSEFTLEVTDADRRGATQTLTLTTRTPDTVKTDGAGNTLAANITPQTADANCVLDDSQTQVVNLGGAGAPTSAPANSTLAYGMLQFTMQGCTPGKTKLEVTVVYPDTLPAGTKYWKYGRTQDNPSPHWYVLNSAVISGNSVKFTVVDGAQGDDDLLANGSVTDPIAPIVSNLGIAGSLGDGRVGTSYVASLAVENGVGPFVWSVSAGQLPAGLTLGTTSGQISGTPTAAGPANLTVQVTDLGNGNATASKAFSVQIADANPPRLLNIATRGKVETVDNVMIAGFIIQGSSAKKVLIRARGPSLAAAPFNVPGTLADPFLTLYSGATPIDTNDDFAQHANAAQIPADWIPGNAKEAAIVTTLNPGAYTAIVNGVSSTSGVAIVEVFELDQPGTPLINIATRGPVQTGDNVMIAGLIIQGDAPKTVLITARGPSMAGPPHNVPGTLSDPVLTLYSGQTPIASNDNWPDAANASQIQTAIGAPTNTLESAILITLQPGAYTAIVNGANKITGLGIVEVFAQ